MESPDLYTQAAADYQEQLARARVEINRRLDKITAAKESAYLFPAARELILGDARILAAEIKVLEKQVEVLNKLIVRCVELQSLAHQGQSYNQEGY